MKPYTNETRRLILPARQKMIDAFVNDPRDTVAKAADTLVYVLLALLLCGAIALFAIGIGTLIFYAALSAGLSVYTAVAPIALFALLCFAGGYYLRDKRD